MILETEGVFEFGRMISDQKAVCKGKAEQVQGKVVRKATEGDLKQIENNNNLWKINFGLFKIHLIRLNPKEEKTINAQAESIYKMLLDKGIEVLYDDRADKTAGEKFSDADLIGIPKRMVISEKTLAKNSVEIKDRKTGKIDLIKISNIKNAKSFI